LRQTVENGGRLAAVFLRSPKLELPVNRLWYYASLMMKKIAIALTLPLLLAATSAQAVEVRQPSTVVELYTSQGCSSCPPADALMGQLVENKKDILGLSLAVTYWDYIGWKDTFGSPQNDIRQAEYRDAMGARYVYTPQMVIAGQDHFVGSDSSKLIRHLEKYKGHAQQIPLVWQIEDNTAVISLPELEGGAHLWRMDIDAVQQVSIGRGENAGRKIAYYNVVRASKLIKSWNGKATKISLNLTDLEHQGRSGCAIIVQRGIGGPIVAALQIDL